MQTTQGNLTILWGDTVRVFWKGVEINFVKIYSRKGKIWITVTRGTEVPENTSNIIWRKI